MVSALAMHAEAEAERARDQLTMTRAGIAKAVGAVRKVDGAHETIADDVGRVHQTLGTMAQDNIAQSASLTEITAAITDMNRSTQQNAAMVEETSAAARKLTNEVKAFAGQAAKFSIDQDGGSTRSALTPMGRTRPALTIKPVASGYALH